jgi:hypothetical protein
MTIIFTAFAALMVLMVACFLLRPTPNRTFYKKGSKILSFLPLPYFATAQLYISPKQISLDGADQVIEVPLTIAITADSVYLWRNAEVKTSYPLNSIRRKKYGVSIRFGANKLKLHFGRLQPNGGFLRYQEKEFFLYFKEEEGV